MQVEIAFLNEYHEEITRVPVEQHVLKFEVKGNGLRLSLAYPVYATVQNVIVIGYRWAAGELRSPDIEFTEGPQDLRGEVGTLAITPFFEMPFEDMHEASLRGVKSA